jgi:hypothetical protein
MKNIKTPAVKAAAATLQSALANGTSEEQGNAFESFTEAVADSIRADFDETHGDMQALQSRGYRQLTSQEKSFYEAWIDNAKSIDPKQSFADILNDGMPVTIIQDVMKNLTNEHPLLDAINFTNVGYATKWILNNHTAQTAAWGTITSAITQEITSSFKVIDLSLNKLSAFCLVPKDLLDLGVTFLDAYARAIIQEAFATQLEAAVVSGDGNGKPIGLTRDIHVGVSVTSGAYPDKTAVAVTDFTPKSYGALVAQMAKTETGVYRTIDRVGLICNPVDYFNKVMPATTVMNLNGTYNGMVTPFPTDIIQSNALAEGKAIMAVLPEYNLVMGTPKNGNIAYDDSAKFLEDARAYIIKGFANGRAFDNTSALYLDISKLTEAYVTVKQVTSA